MSDVVEGRVRLHDRDVGTLYYEKGGASFFYEDDLTAPDHKTLGQIFEDDPRKQRRARVGLPPWFANLLPEGELRKQIIREMGGGYVRDFTRTPILLTTRSGIRSLEFNLSIQFMVIDSHSRLAATAHGG
jgi:HipA-like protein